MSMIKRVLLSSFTAMICMTSLYASEKEVLSPDGRLKVEFLLIRYSMME